MRTTILASLVLASTIGCSGQPSQPSALYLLPKSAPIVIGCLFLIFILLLHPLWHFWWIEKSLKRRIIACACLVVALVLLGWISWPELAPQSTQPTQPSQLEVGQLWQQTINDPFDEYGPIRTFRILDLKTDSEGERWVQSCWVEIGCAGKVSEREVNWRRYMKLVKSDDQ